MYHASLVRLLAVWIGVGWLVAACADKPEPLAGPTPNGQPVVVAAEISGPGSIPPGQSAQFAAIIRFSDGTTRTATTNVRWSSEKGLIRLDGSGLATAGQQTGDDILSAEVSTESGPRRSTKEIVVLHQGTFRMIGVVTENGQPPTPIVGARVEVAGGTPTAISDWDGRFRLYGVPGTGTIRVTRDGYQPHVQDFQLIDHVTQNFHLMLSGTRLNLAGQYTLAIDAACATSTPVAVDLRHRSYAATLTQSGATLEVLLTEPRFRINSAGRGNRFSGRVDTASVTFNLEDFAEQDYDNGVTDPATYANVVESLPSGNFLIVTGTVLIREASSALSGNLQGFVSSFDSRFPTIPLLSSATGTCYSHAHRLTLTRR
jgi:hypothetical protein